MLRSLLRLPQSHWSGDLSPLPAILGVVLGLRLAVFSIGGLWLAADLALFVWQTRGGLRSLNHHLDRGPHLVPYLAGLMALLICTLLTALPHIDQLARQQAVPLPPWQARAGDVTLKGNQVILRGEVDFAMLDTLTQILKEAPEVQEVLLDSPGGRVHAARGIALMVGERGLNTRVEQICASACTLIFIAGTKRALAPGGKLGFHAYALVSSQVLADPVQEQAKDRRLFLARGVNSGFLDRIEATPHDDMWFPDPDELRAAGVTTSP
jgi:ATP-dependent protease ClpP protease subunit